MAAATRVLVTGASGYLGGLCARSLLDDGVDVVALGRPGRVPATQQRVGRRLDVLEDPGGADQLEASVDAAGITHVLHLAAAFDGAQREPERLVASNVTFAARVAEAVARAQPGATFVNVATIWQHFGPGGDEPLTLYAATKRAFESILGYYASTELLDVRTVVVPDTYGPDDPRGKIVSLLVQHTVAEEPLDATSGDGVVDLVHVTDVVQALRRALDPDLGPGRWALTSGRPMTVRELAGVVAHVAGQPPDVRWGVRPDRPRRFTQAPRSGPALPGWEPTVPLEQGLRGLLDRARRDRVGATNGSDDGR